MRGANVSTSRVGTCAVRHRSPVRLLCKYLGYFSTATSFYLTFQIIIFDFCRPLHMLTWFLLSLVTMTVESILSTTTMYTVALSPDLSLALSLFLPSRATSCRIIGMGPVVEASLGHIGLAVYLLLVGLASGLVTSTGIFFAYIVTRQEYLLDLVRPMEVPSELNNFSQHIRPRTPLRRCTDITDQKIRGILL